MCDDVRDMGIIIQQSYSYIIVSMLMLIRFLTFWENFFKEDIGKLCKTRAESKKRFLTSRTN